MLTCIVQSILIQSNKKTMRFADNQLPDDNCFEHDIAYKQVLSCLIENFVGKKSIKLVISTYHQCQLIKEIMNLCCRYSTTHNLCINQSQSNCVDISTKKSLICSSGQMFGDPIRSISFMKILGCIFFR